MVVDSATLELAQVVPLGGGYGGSAVEFRALGRSRGSRSGAPGGVDDVRVAASVFGDAGGGCVRVGAAGGARGSESGESGESGSRGGGGGDGSGDRRRSYHRRARGRGGARRRR